MSQSFWNRRQLLKGMGLVGAGVATHALTLPRRARAQGALSSAIGANGRSLSGKNGPTDDARFLIVLCASGGASIIDSVMAIRESESANAANLNCFPDAVVQNIDDSPFRAVNLSSDNLGPIGVPFSSDQASFVRKHKEDMMVATWTRTSVNHAVAQRRSVTGNDAWRGRTLQEAAALEYGQSCVLPNAHLITGSGCTERGADDGLPQVCYGEAVPDPTLWPLALHGSRGIGRPVDGKLLARARALRNEVLERDSAFSRTFGNSTLLQHWNQLRGERQQALESADLISKLMLFSDAEVPLSQYGLSSSPDAATVRAAFPAFAEDPLHAQAALAFLLLKYRISVSVTLGPGFDAVFEEDIDFSGGGIPEGAVKNPPLAFDFSHQGHRSSQAFMWDRLFGVADSLIGLLKSEEYADGQSLWDRSMIYIASDFGRSKNRPSNSEDFGSAHDLNNGVMVLSPLANGNQVLGGVDPDTGMTYGFDPRTGAPEPGRTMSEGEIYAGVVQALGIDTSGSGLPDMAAMRKG